MALDNLTLKIIASELEKQLVGTVFGKPLSLSAYDYAYPFSLKENDGTIRHGTFIFSMNPANPLVTFSHDRYEKVDDCSPFFNSLRKLALAKVTKVTKHEGERIITISLDSNSNDLSEVNTGYDLILELFPNRPNCYIVAYPYGKIVSLYREKTNIEKGIFITRNVAYVYPPYRPSLNMDVKTLEDTKKYLSYSVYRYFEEYVGKSGESFSACLQDLIDSKDLYLKEKEILPFSFGLSDVQKIRIEDMYSSLVADQKKLAKLQKEKELISLIEKAVRISKKKSLNLDSDLKTATDNLKYLEYGQEIYLHQDKIKKGDKIISVDGYDIPLNPLLDGPNNANRYFHKYSKAKSAIGILSDLIVKSKDETDYLEKKLLESKDGTPRDIMELKSELLQEGYIKEKQVRNHVQKVSKKKTYEPHYLLLDNGKIGFGMNGLQNETLTFKIADKNDLFFHVKDYPGSHVVILEGQDQENVKTTACELALYLSHLDSGTIMIARRKNVKKNPDRIGLVSILKYDTVNVRYIRATSLELFKKVLKA